MAIVLPEIEYCLLFCLSAIPGTSVAWVLDTLSLLAQGICKRTWTCLVTTAPHVNHMSRNLCGAEGEHTHRDLGSSFQWNMCYWRNYFRKENPGINYLLHVESNESRKNMVPENLKTIYANSKNP